MPENRYNFFICLMFFVSFCCYFLFSSRVDALDFTQMTLEELMDVQVTSVSKKKQPLADSAAAVFVITREDIKRSGVTNIPDALRMVPGLNVGRIDASKWGVSSRGFNGRFVCYLLVFIDGRSIYTPSFSGVYWENNGVFMEDIERIEVIRGPGGTIWGANAVNGVINIITRKAKDTQGGYFEIGSGSKEKRIAGIRYGGSINSKTFWRIYAKNHEWGQFDLDSGENAHDDWGINQAGFRMDSALTEIDELTIIGDIYKGKIHHKMSFVTASPPFMSVNNYTTDISGSNINIKWERTFDEKSDFKLSFYYDTSSRKEAFIDEKNNCFFFDFQNRFPAGSRHDIIWGAGYRHYKDDLESTDIIKMETEDEHHDFFTAFFQDEISFLKNRLFFIIGSKFEKNEYTGFELQPGARLLWKINDKHRLWASVSKAVRIPSRIEVSATIKIHAFDSGKFPGLIPGAPSGIPVILRFLPVPHKENIKLIAYETGYRFMKNDVFSMDLALFFNNYKDIRGTIIPPLPEGLTYDGTAFYYDLAFANNLDACTYGGELSLNFIHKDTVRCNLGYSFIETDFKDNRDYGSSKHQVSLRAGFNPMPYLSIDAWLRYVDKIKTISTLEGTPFYDIDPYTSLDLRIGWDIRKNITLSVVGQNLLKKDNLEFAADSFNLFTRNPRMFYIKLNYKF